MIWGGKHLINGKAPHLSGSQQSILLLSSCSDYTPHTHTHTHTHTHSSAYFIISSGVIVSKNLHTEKEMNYIFISTLYYNSIIIYILIMCGDIYVSLLQEG